MARGGTMPPYNIKQKKCQLFSTDILAEIKIEPSICMHFRMTF